MARTVFRTRARFCPFVSDSSFNSSPTVGPMNFSLSETWLPLTLMLSGTTTGAPARAISCMRFSTSILRLFSHPRKFVSRVAVFWTKGAPLPKCAEAITLVEIPGSFTTLCTTTRPLGVFITAFPPVETPKSAFTGLNGRAPPASRPLTCASAILWSFVFPLKSRTLLSPFFPFQRRASQ